MDVPHPAVEDSDLVFQLVPGCVTDDIQLHIRNRDAVLLLHFLTTLSENLTFIIQ